MVDFDVVRMLLAVSAARGWLVHMEDVCTAFLNDGLEEPVFMFQPKGFEKQGFDQFVCLLKKSLYGFRVSSRIWKRTFQKHLRSAGFRMCVRCPCVYIEKDGVAFDLAYVDGTLICGAHEKDIQEVKISLAKGFEIKDLGVASHLFGI